jgi:hypothetical protein
MQFIIPTHIGTHNLLVILFICSTSHFPLILNSNVSPAGAVATAVRSYLAQKSHRMQH